MTVDIGPALSKFFEIAMTVGFVSFVFYELVSIHLARRR